MAKEPEERAPTQTERDAAIKTLEDEKAARFQKMKEAGAPVTGKPPKD